MRVMRLQRIVHLRYHASCVFVSLVLLLSGKHLAILVTLIARYKRWEGDQAASPLIYLIPSDVKDGVKQGKLSDLRS